MGRITVGQIWAREETDLLAPDQEVAYLVGNLLTKQKVLEMLWNLIPKLLQTGLQVAMSLSRDRPVSGKSQSSTKSASNDNNNNKGSVRSESAKTYATEGIEPLERTPRNLDVAVLEPEQDEILYQANSCVDGVINGDNREGVENTERNGSNSNEKN